MSERLSVDEYYVEIALTVAKRATCLRNKVGAVIVRDNHILTTGYNGAPRGLAHCLDIGCLRNAQNIPSGTFRKAKHRQAECWLEGRGPKSSAKRMRKSI